MGACMRLPAAGQDLLQAASLAACPARLMKTAERRMESPKPKYGMPTSPPPPGTSRIVLLGCGLANRLMTMGSELERHPNTRFYWPTASMAGVHFSELFDVAGGRAPEFVYEVPVHRRWAQYPGWDPVVEGVNVSAAHAELVPKAKLDRTDKAFNRSVASCYSPRSSKSPCPSWLTSLRPPAELVPALRALRVRLGPSVGPMLHVRNSSERSLSGKGGLYRTKSWKLDLMVRDFPYVYAATQDQDSAALIQRLNASIVLQGSVRDAHYDRSSRQGLLSAVFDLFALSMTSLAHESAGTVFHTSSSFVTATRCLRATGQEPLCILSNVWGKHPSLRACRDEQEGLAQKAGRPRWLT